MAPKRKSFATSSARGKRPLIVDTTSESESDASPPSSSPMPTNLPTPVSISDPIFSLPTAWFKNKQTQGMWEDGYSQRSICFCEQLDIPFVESANLPCLSLFKSSHLWKLINPGEVAYPRLTRLFYLNMIAKRENKELTLETNVKSHKIVLTKTVLAQILGTPNTISTDSHPSRTECVSRAKEAFFLSSAPRPRQPTHSILNLEAKVLHTLIVRCITPRSNSRELVTDQTLEIIYLILHNFQLDVPHIILTHMLHSISGSRAYSLPYANLLPKIFKFFNVPLKNEETSSTVPSIINGISLSRLGIVQTLKGDWKLRSELTPQGQNTLPSSSKGKSPALDNAPDSTSSSSLNQRLEEIEFSLDSLKHDMMDMHSVFSEKLDETYQLLAMVNSKINQMFYLSALNFTATGSIMPLTEDAAEHTRERAANVILNCERQVRDRPILRPTHSEPTILTVEEYGVVKKYRDAEAQRRIDEMIKDKTFADALNRRRRSYVDEVRRRRAGGQYWYSK